MSKRIWIPVMCIASLFCLIVVLPIVCWAKPWSSDGYYTQPWVLDSVNPFQADHKYMTIEGDSYKIQMISQQQIAIVNTGTINKKTPQHMVWTDVHGKTSQVSFISYSFRHSQGISKVYNPLKLFMIKWLEMTQD